MLDTQERPPVARHPAAEPADAALLAILETLRAQGYHFTTVTPASHARVNARPQNAVARSIADVFGWSRPFHPAVLTPDLFGRMQAADILDATGNADAPWRSRLRVSGLGGMLFMHSAFPTLAPDSVFFGPDTHKFVDAIGSHLARRATPVARAADICCGAGPGALAIARATPQAEVLMVDINDAALRLARVNAAFAGAAGARAVNSNLLSAAPGDFDLIVAHPPYLIDRGSRAYRHGGGPFGAGLSLAIADAAIGRLRARGTLLLFTGIAMIGNQDPFLDEIEPMLHNAGMRWSYREVDLDVFGEELDRPPYDEADRIALVVLEASRPA